MEPADKWDPGSLGGRSSDVKSGSNGEDERTEGDREAWAQMRGRGEEIRNGALLCLCEYESACGNERNQSALWRTAISWDARS